MGKKYKTLSKIRETLLPKTWGEWELEVSDYQEQSDYITVDFVYSNHSLAPEAITLLDANRLNLDIENGKNRRNKYSSFETLHNFSSGAFLPSLTATALIFLLIGDTSVKNLLSLKSYPSIAFISFFGLTVTSAIFSKITSIKIKNLSLNRLEKPITEYSKKSRQNEVILLHEINTQIKQSAFSLYIQRTDGTFMKVMNDYWRLDNWELGLLQGLNAREALPLTGNPPGGKFYILKNDYLNSEMYEKRQASLKAEAEEKARAEKKARAEEKARAEKKARAEEKARLEEKAKAEERNPAKPKKNAKPKNKAINKQPPKLKTPDSRNSVRQANALKSLKNIKKLVALICTAYPKKTNGKRKGLNPSRLARLEALEYIIKYPEFWKEIRNNKASIDNEKYHIHRAELIEIFSKIQRTKDTRKPNSQKLMYDFVDMKNRSFEQWLEKLNWKITG